MKRALILLTLAVFLTGVVAGQPQENSSVEPGLMPGNPFYTLEQTVENLEVGLAGAIGGDDMRAKALANNAEERLAEANALAERNRSEEAAEMIDSYSRTINRSQSLVDEGNNTELSESIRTISNRNQQVLEEVKQKVPEQAREGIQKAINNSRKMTGTPGKPENPGKSRGQPGKGVAENISGKADKANKSIEKGREKIENATGKEKGKEIINRTEKGIRNSSEKFRNTSDRIENTSETVEKSFENPSPEESVEGSVGKGSEGQSADDGENNVVENPAESDEGDLLNR